MENQQIQNYVTQSRQAGKSDDQIRPEILAVGWRKREVDEFANMVARGLENTVTKDDSKELRGEMNIRFSAVNKRLDKLDY